MTKTDLHLFNELVNNITSRYYTVDKYQEEASRTINTNLDNVDILQHALFGIGSETGEIQGIFQKGYQGHTVNTEELKTEIGDLLWFVAELCTVYEWDMSDIMKLNISKLKERYPDGFDPDKSINRKV